MEESELTTYIKQITGIKVIDQQETQRLARLAKEGDLEARNRLVEGNLRFVSKIANTYKGKGLPVADLINEGSLGLITAAERFDPDSGNAFLTYAKFWIHQAISQALKDKGRLIRLPANKVEKLSRVLSCKTALESTTDEEVTVEDIARESGVDPEEVRICLAVKDDATSLDIPLQGIEDRTLMDTIESSLLSPEQCVENSDFLAQIENILNTLPDRHREVLVRRYGLFNTRAQSLDEVGKHFGITRERVRQIEGAALKMLRKQPQTQNLSIYLDSRVAS